MNASLFCEDICKNISMLYRYIDIIYIYVCTSYVYLYLDIFVLDAA